MSRHGQRKAHLTQFKCAKPLDWTANDLPREGCDPRTQNTAQRPLRSVAASMKATERPANNCWATAA